MGAAMMAVLPAPVREMIPGISLVLAAAGCGCGCGEAGAGVGDGTVGTGAATAGTMFLWTKFMAGSWWARKLRMGEDTT